jgi:cytochrome c5
MSQEQHAAGHESPIKTPKQLIVAIVLAFLVPIVIITLLSQYVANIRSVDMDSTAMTSDAVAKRLKPVADLAFAEAGAGDAGAALRGGAAVYQSACSACHASGAAGAPKAGDKTAWAPRLKAGVNSLYANALKGKGAMPAKGGNAALADAEVKAAVDYLLGLAK